MSELDQGLLQKVDPWLSENYSFYHVFGRGSLSRLLHRWREFAHQVSDGYEMSIYDYEDDLAIRSVLADLLCEVPDILTTLGPLIQPIDDQFYAATAVNEGFARRYSLELIARYPWLGRLPKKLYGELLDDIRPKLTDL